MKSQFFVNPYNFIPFGKTIDGQRRSREEVYRGKNALVSGWLTVSLDTKHPLIIPDGAHPKYCIPATGKYVENPGVEEKKKLHKEYRFLRIPCENDQTAEQAVIPGSELHGMIRSVYEAATDSCVSFLLDDKPISQRVPTFGALRKRGLLAYEPVAGKETRHWVLYAAVSERVLVTIDGNKMTDEDNRAVTSKNGDFVEGKGWLQYNIPVNKRNYHIAYLNIDKENGMAKVVHKWKEGEQEPYDLLKLALYGKRKNPNAEPNQNLRKALENAKSGEGNLVPVYYFTVKRGEEELVYMSNSAIGRIAQKRKWADIMGEHAPCTDTDRLCPACLLFGTVKGKGLKGHIRVTDALPVGELKSEKHTLQILGEPRTSAFEFYLRKPEETATYWNFDFYGEKVYPKKGNPYTEYQDLGQAPPRGRKMYWHGKVAPDASKGNMNSTMEAMRGSFEFKVYFDEITEEQLQNLIWVITLGDNRSESTRWHKLGHARPLGYGSVKLVVTEETIRRISAQGDSVGIKLDTMKKDDIRIASTLNLNSERIRSLLKMCDANAVPENVPVMYPKEMDKSGNEFIYTWFAQNRRSSSTLQILPEPTNSRITLSRWRITGRVKSFDATKNIGYITDNDGIDYEVKIDRKFNPNLKAGELSKGKKVLFAPKRINGKNVANQCEVIRS